MTTWGELRTVVRRSLLDDLSGNKFSDDVLRDSVGWALDRLCQHTAAETSVSYVGNGSQTAFTLPANMYDTPDNYGLVHLESSSDLVVLRPVYSSKSINIRTERGYYVWPRTTLNLVMAPLSDQLLVVRYYAVYNHPMQDSDVLDIPQWAEMAVAYQAAVYALSKRSYKESNISQFDRKPDSGTPEDNAIRMQQEFLQRMVDKTLNDHPKQVRLNPNQGER